MTNSVQAGLAVGIASDGGPSRERNEDFAGSYLAASGALIAVADGMGGHQAGDVASRLLVESLLARFAASSGRLQDRLLTALEQANLEVFQASRQAGHRGMGATLVVVALEGNVALIASAGDARAYLLRGGGSYSPDQGPLLGSRAAPPGPASHPGVATPPVAPRGV